jgi:predicted transcriptional regulator
LSIYIWFFICAVIFTVFGYVLSIERVNDRINEELQQQIDDLIENGFLKTVEQNGELYLVPWDD